MKRDLLFVVERLAAVLNEPDSAVFLHLPQIFGIRPKPGSQIL
jgi:hypothetical protein